MKLGNLIKVVCGALAVLFVGVFSANAFNFGKYENAKANNGVVTIAADKLADGKVRFYKFQDSGKDIAFFAVKATDGSYRPHLMPVTPVTSQKKDMNRQVTR